MSLDHSLVGVPGEPQERSWTSTDALLYAIGVGAGLGDPLQELEFTTENTAGVAAAGAADLRRAAGAGAGPAGSLGDFDRAMLVHAEQSIELHQPLPVDGHGAHRLDGDRHLRQGLRRAGGVAENQAVGRGYRRAGGDDPGGCVHPRRGRLRRRPRHVASRGSCRTGRPTTRSPADPAGAGPALPAVR